MKKILVGLFILIIVFSIFWLTFLWKIFKSSMAGSYPSVETWTLKINEHRLLEIIKQIRKEHPELNSSPQDTSTVIKDRYWYHIIFYYNDTNEKVQTWIRANNDTSYTTLALVAVSKNFNSATAKDNFKIERKEINKDFNYFENRAEIKKFKTRILDLITQKLQYNSR